WKKRSPIGCASALRKKARVSPDSSETCSSGRWSRRRATRRPWTASSLASPHASAIQGSIPAARSSMTALVFVDANVLLYRHDIAKPEKQEAAAAWLAHLWRMRSGRVSMQVLQEFYVNATQKLKPGLDRQSAREEVRDLMTWNPIPIDGRMIEGAWGLQ